MIKKHYSQKLTYEKVWKNCWINFCHQTYSFIIVLVNAEVATRHTQLYLHFTHTLRTTSVANLGIIKQQSIHYNTTLQLLVTMTVTENVWLRSYC